MKFTKEKLEKVLKYWQNKNELYEKMIEECKEQLSTAKGMIDYFTSQIERIDKK